MGDVAVEEVEASGVALLLDLTEELLDGDGGVGGTACAQVVAVGVDQRRPVARRPAQGLRFTYARVPLDGVQGDVQPTGAFEQANALAEQVVDLVPAFAGGLLTGPAGAGRVDPGPAGGVGPHLGECLVAEIAP